MVADTARENLMETDRRIREYESSAEDNRGRIRENQGEMENQQEIMQFKFHGQAVEKIEKEEMEGIDDISREIREWIRRITEGTKVLKEQEEVERRYDEAAGESSRCLAAVIRRNAELEKLEEEREQNRDSWIEACYELPKKNQEFIPEQQFLKEMETEILAYEGPKDRGRIRRRWEQWASDRQSLLIRLKGQKVQERDRICSDKTEKQEELKSLKEQKDWEPERSKSRIRSRDRLTEAGISWIPFYQAMEFAPWLEAEEKDLLEEQLADAGFLDALLVERCHWDRVREEFPEYMDMMICAPESETGKPFDRLVPASGLPSGLQAEAEYVLRAMWEEKDDLPGKGREFPGRAGISLNADGFFRNGILEGRSLGSRPASFIGQLTRKQRLEQQILLLSEELEAVEQQEKTVEEEIRILEGRQETLEQELAQAPDGEILDGVLDREKECRWYLEQEEKKLEEARRKEERIKAEKERCLQQVIRMGRELPYARTLSAYEEAAETCEDYWELWSDTCAGIRDLSHQKALLEHEKERDKDYEESQDIALREISEKTKELEIVKTIIQKAEEFLNRPENRQLAMRLKELRTEKENLELDLKKWGERLAVIGSQKELGARQLEEMKGNQDLKSMCRGGVGFLKGE